MPVRRTFIATLALAGAFSILAAAPANAGILGMSMSGNDTSSLYLDDGTWDEGLEEDWYYSISPTDPTYGQAWLNETWVGGNPVSFNLGVEADSDPDVSITKTLNNDTNFDWTDFHIDLIPLPGFGPIIVNPASVASSRFSDNVVTNNPDGSAEIDWFTNPGLGDTPVLVGQSVTLFFTFNIPGTVAMTMIQMPTPEPGTLALLALGGLTLVRRRRK